MFGDPRRIQISMLNSGTSGLPPGSFVAASHLTGEHDRDAWATIEADYRAAGISAQWRDSDEFAEIAFAGLELVPPGIVLVSEWGRSDSGPLPPANEVNAYCGVAHKP